LNVKEEIWNLTPLFSSVTDPTIDQAVTEAIALANNFEKAYRGRITSLSTDGLYKCLQEIETFEAKFSDITLYSSLSFAADMTLPQTQALHDRINKLEATISKQLAFFSLELGELVKAEPELIKDPILANYKHMLERVQRRVEHLLSEIEEQLIIEKDQFGVNAWEELQSKWLNTRLFEIIVMGEKKTLNYGEANGLLIHPDRATRESAHRSIYGLVGKDGEVFSAALRSICNDWVTMCKRRKYVTPMESSLISNDTRQDIIDDLVQTIEKGAPIYQRYLKIKAKLFGLPVLGNHDIVAPIPNTPEKKYSLKEAKVLITKAYKRFDKDYANAIEEMFQEHRIDATPRFGKRNGAFCASDYNRKSAFILQSFNGTLNDVYTLAHELGHSTHDWYASRSQTLLNMNIPSIIAETASIFGELLLTDLLVNEAQTDEERKAVLCFVLDELGITTFQVTARIWFEQALYKSIQKGEFLNYEIICNHWIKARNRIYGKTIEWFPEMQAEWTIKPHYYMANYRFYNYPYVYAQMFVNVLYNQYQKEGKIFVPKLKQALSAGSSVQPSEIGAIMGLDVTSPNFWDMGMRTFKHFITDLEKII
jgi:oligoendopeptidase F